jgi:hypothetical protein
VEESARDHRRFLQSAQGVGGFGFEFVLAGDAGLADAVVFDVLPQPFVRSSRPIASRVYQTPTTARARLLGQFLGAADALERKLAISPGLERPDRERSSGRLRLACPMGENAYLVVLRFTILCCSVARGSQ